MTSQSRIALYTFNIVVYMVTAYVMMVLGVGVTTVGEIISMTIGFASGIVVCLFVERGRS